jgi:hypothetical protein
MDHTEYQLAELVAMTRELGAVKAERDRLRHLLIEIRLHYQASMNPHDNEVVAAIDRELPELHRMKGGE